MPGENPLDVIAMLWRDLDEKDTAYSRRLAVRNAAKVASAMFVFATLGHLLI
jgi:hypothetical protein